MRKDYPLFKDSWRLKLMYVSHKYTVRHITGKGKKIVSGKEIRDSQPPAIQK